MELRVEVKHQDGEILYFCRGSLVQGQASEYLFDLLTRSCSENVLVDLAGIRDFDAVGLQTLGLALAFLNRCNCRLALQHAPPALIERLHRNHEEPRHASSASDSEPVETSDDNSQQAVSEPSVLSTS